VQPDAEQAKKEKALCRVALERGRLTEAVEAGERAVALDPTDGEAWLILGAAYQSKGNSKDARRCYKSCVQEGKRGPRNECAAMLR
jgi:Flp pilus assembly protein TadD